MKTDEERFTSGYTVDPSGCWLWGGTRGRYGQFRGFGQSSSHRASWVRANGAIPGGMLVCHRCDTPACVNPDHLFLGTQRDNILDMHAKGRNHDCRGQRPTRQPTAEERARGERMNRGVLTEAVVAEFRRRVRSGEKPYTVARSLSIKKGTVNDLAHMRTWAHVL